MNSKRFSNSPCVQSPGYGFTNSQNRNFSPLACDMKNSSAASSPFQGWGTPARGYSPFNFQRPNCNMSPRNQQISPRHQNYCKSPVSPQCRFPGSKESSPFRTPQHKPFSPPGNFRGGYRGSGRKSFDRQNPRFDPNCNPGSSRNIEDYYHPDMLEDPWNFCTPVPVSISMETT